MKIPITVFAFNNGEVSPRIEGRQDFPKYKNSVKEMVNFLPLTSGGARRRPGFHFVKRAKNSGEDNDAVRLVRFKFSLEQVYVVEFGHLYVRFYRGGARVESPPGTPVEVVTPYGGSDLGAISFVGSADTLYILHELFKPRKLLRTAVDVFLLQIINFDAPATVEHSPNGAELAAGFSGAPPPPPEDPGEGTPTG